MRLIDADALKEKTLAHGGKIAYVVSFLWDIDEAPTIDAIPVSWLREFCVDDISDDQRETIEWMMGIWQREQEATSWLD